MFHNNNQSISSAYDNYLQYFRETFPTIQPPSFQAWLQLYNIPQYQQPQQLPPSFQTMSSQREEKSDTFSETASTTSTSNSEPCSSQSNMSGKQKRDRWSKDQNAALVESWKEHFAELETSRQQGAWQKIKERVDNAGPAKTLKQIKTKLKNLKGSYKQAPDNNKQSGAAPQYPPFYEDFDEMLGTRDSVNLPAVTEVGSKKLLWREEQTFLASQGNFLLVFKFAPSGRTASNQRRDV